MYIIHIAAELSPIAKVGGLADVLGGLSTQLAGLGHDVDIIIPKYDCLHSDSVNDLRVYRRDLKVYYDGQWHSNTVWIGWVGNIKVYFIDPHHDRYFFDRGCIYGCEDDTERFLYFSRAAMEFMYKEGLTPDVLHLHDWQCAIIPTLYRDLYKNWGMNIPRTVLTIHNMAYQGKCSPTDIEKIGLEGGMYLRPEKMQDNASRKTINLLKGGIVDSDVVTTVSPSYAKEILTPEGGQGLENTLKLLEGKLIGVLNGIDYAYWNPETDPKIPANYSSRDIPKDKDDRHTIDKKAFIKKSLREALMLEELHRPIIGCITRLVPQKGLDLIKHSISQVAERGGQFILLGSGPIPSINAEFHALRHQYIDHPHIRLILQHDEAFAHFLYAGCDMMVVPSLFEPCGLVQLIALRYGTVPIVHKTGGLGDTITDVEHESPQSNGYLFGLPDPNEMNRALNRAITCWYEEPDRWRKLVVRGMNQDFSWKKSANKYLEIYAAQALST